MKNQQIDRSEEKWFMPGNGSWTFSLLLIARSQKRLPLGNPFLWACARHSGRIYLPPPHRSHFQPWMRRYIYRKVTPKASHLFVYWVGQTSVPLATTRSSSRTSERMKLELYRNTYGWIASGDEWLLHLRHLILEEVTPKIPLIIS